MADCLLWKKAFNKEKLIIYTTAYSEDLRDTIDSNRFAAFGENQRCKE